jgi:hypothetical protein
MQHSNSAYFTLQDGALVPATRLAWERWWNQHPEDRLIARSELGDAEIVTECLGLRGAPFRGMIRGGRLDGTTVFYDDLESAMQGHEWLVGRAEAAWL